MNKTIIIKLGGSAITKKNQNKPQTNKKLLHNICLGVSKIKNKRIVLVHGAGAFGHKPVSEFGLNNGVRTRKDLFGFCFTRSLVQKLNNLVVSELVSVGVPAVSVNPFDVIQQSGKKISKFDLSKIKLLLDKNCVPVLFGDMVFDSKLGFSVVSGDAIVPFLAKKLGAELVLLGTDVDGLYTDDPKKNRGARKILELNNENYLEILSGLKESNSVDVTGGMRGKILELKKNLKNVETIVFDLTKKNNLVKVINGKKIGTRIMFK